MAKKWSEVIQSAGYQALSSEQKREAQQEYALKVLAPQVPKEERGVAIREFYTAYPTTADPTEGMSEFEKGAAGAGKFVADLGRGAGQVLGVTSQDDVAEARRLDAPLMKTASGKTGNIAGALMTGLPLSFVPGANSLVGSALIGGGMGFLQPVGEGESRLMNAGFGTATGGAGYGFGKVLGKSVSAAGNKVGQIEAKVSAKAAADAASETASARSAAGNAAQNAYRQLEHLRELKAMGLLNAEQAQVAAQLEKELSEKAMEKLLPAAAQKASTAQAFKEAVETESKRAAEKAAEKLSGSEIKSQIMARVKRYGPAAVGGAVGSMIFPGLGGFVGGAATGLTLRPALRSMVNLSKTPAVQHRLLSPIARAGLLGDAALPPTLGLLGGSLYAAD